MDVIVFVLQVLFIIWALSMIGVCLLFIIGAARGGWSDTYPFEAAEAPPDPVEQAFADARRIVSGRLPSSSVDELVEAFDWHGHEYEMRSR